MPASYKLRLSDGTVLVVDHDGLSTWLVDDKAMVQLVGSSLWRPLKAFLAGERAAARNASREKPNAAVALPLIPPPPRKEEPPPRKEEPPPPREPVKPLSLGEPPAAQVPLREPATPVRTRLDSKAGEAFPSIPPPRREEAPRQAEPPPRDPVEPLFPAAPPAAQVLLESVEPGPADEVADAAWSAEAERRLEEVLPGEPAAPGGTLPAARAEETPRHEAELPPSEPAEPLFPGEPPAAQVLIDSVEHEPADEGADAAWSAEGSRRLEEVVPWEPAASVRTRLDSKGGDALPVIPPPTWEEAPRQAEPPPSEPVEPLVLSEPPAVQIVADAPVVPPAEPVSHEPTPEQHVAPIPQKPVDDAAYNRPAPSPWSEPLEPSIGARPNLLVLADDLAGSHSANAVQTPASDDALPIIRLKPRDDQDEKPQAVRPAAREVQPWQDARDEKLFRSVASIGGFLSVWLGRLDRQLGRLSSIRPERSPYAAGRSDALAAPPSVSARPKLQVLAEEPTEPRDGFSRGRSTPDPVPPILPVKTLSQAPQSAPPKPPSPFGGLTQGDHGGTRKDHAPPSVAPSAAGPDPHEPLKAPQPISELPILRLADIDEPKAASDVYGRDVYEGESLIRTAGRWTKRVVVITVLLASGTLAALTRETWLPKAARLTRTVFTEIDKHARSREQTERRQRALQEAAEQLPHLAPATIELVLSGGVLDPPGVFRLACDAADRGLSALAPGEAQELKALRQEMLETLRPEERQRALEYDGARGRRLTLPFEDRDVLELVARSALALPPASRVRFQVLSGKAIAAGLVQDPPVGLPRPEGD